MSSGECLQTNRSSDTNEPAAVAGKQSKSMKVFLRNTQSGWYFQEPSKWTPAQEEALDLTQVARAVEQIFATHLENVEILLCYDDPRYDLILPVPPSPSQGEASRQRQPSPESLAGQTGRSGPPEHRGRPL